MATVAEKAPSKNGAKEKAPQNRKSAKDTVQKGNKGILKVMVQAAFGLAGQNEWKGTKNAGNGTKQGSLVYSVTKDGGKIDRLGENSDMYKNFLTKGKAALKDVSESAYTPAVQGFVDEVFKLQVPSESKAVILKGVKFE